MRLATICAVLVLAGCSGDSTTDNNALGGSDAGDAAAGDAAHTSDAASGADAKQTSGDTGESDAATTGDAAVPGADGDTPDTGERSGCGEAAGQLLWPDAPWNTAVDEMPLAADSEAIIAYLDANQQTQATFQIDFSLTVLTAGAETPKMPFNPTADHYSPDCDTSPVPVPADGAIEGESGYACESDGDCHLIVHAPGECRLYEMWRADISGSEFNGGCLAVWETDRAYNETLRGDYCTSADAAGLPIAPLLVTPDEVVAGDVKHALRFVLPNARIREDVFVRPGTHSTPATSGSADAPPYSALLRLRSDVDLSGLTPAQRTIAHALKTYGMYLADAGNLTFTMSSDRFTDHTWEEAGLEPQDMKWLEWTDFEVVDSGAEITWSDGDCGRMQITN